MNRYSAKRAAVDEVDSEVGVSAAVITKPNKNQGIVVAWMIEEFSEDTVYTRGPSQFVSISKGDIKNPKNANMVAAGGKLGTDFPGRCQIDNQDPVIIGKKPNLTVYVNIQPQIGNGSDRLSFAHVNVIEGRNVGRALIRQALTLSMGDQTSRWIVPTGATTYVITTERPAA